MDRSVLLAHCDIWSGQPMSDVVHLPHAPTLHFGLAKRYVLLKQRDNATETPKIQ
jgi:hypothetical protein